MFFEKKKLFTEKNVVPIINILRYKDNETLIKIDHELNLWSFPECIRQFIPVEIINKEGDFNS
jgi:hypothetical protein